MGVNETVRRADPTKSKRQEAHFAVPFFCLAGAPDQHEIVDHGTKSHGLLANEQQAGHRFAAMERIHRGEPMTGLLLVRQQPVAFRAVINNLVLIWSASEAEEWHGKVSFLDRKSVV